jgi:hypothetical protein
VYFLNTFRSLPVEAVKVAARNLDAARDVYGLADWNLRKLAEPTIGETMPPGPASVAEPKAGPRVPPPGGELAPGAITPEIQRYELQGKKPPAEPKPQMAEGESAERANAVINMLERYMGERKEKKADLTGTEAMPIGQKPPKTSKEVKKLAAMGNEVPLRGPYFDQVYPLEKRASLMAGPYPIDDIRQIQELDCCFLEKTAEFPIPMRAKIARVLRARQESMGLSPSEPVALYSSDHYLPSEELVGALAQREKLGAFMGKEVDYSCMADVRVKASAQEYAEKLASLDKKNGLDAYWNSQWIGDPWKDTLGLEKRATIVYSKGDVFVSDKHIEQLATQEREALCKVLDKDVVEEFCKNPLTVFNSMPEPTKKILGRLAMDRQWRGEMR